MDRKEERLFKNLNDCLRTIGSSDIASLMPLLYVLYAHEKGYDVSFEREEDGATGAKNRIQIVRADNGTEPELLGRIRTSVSETFFEGKYADAIAHFYESNKESIRDLYRTIIEYIIVQFSTVSGRFTGMFETPAEIAQLMAVLVARMKPEGIYDPFAGACAIVCSSPLENIPFVGQEVSPLVKIIADVRLDAAQKGGAAVLNEDSTRNWRGSQCDCLASDLPFGGLLVRGECTGERSFMLDDYVLDNFLHTESLRKAVLLVTPSTCFRRGSSADVRRSLCEQNCVDTVIGLPSAIFPSTGISTVILVLNKDRDGSDVRFVKADDCFTGERRHRVLDTEAVLNRLEGEDKSLVAAVPVEEVMAEHCDLQPHHYLKETIALLPGQKLVQFLSVTSKVGEIRRYSEERGRVLKPEHLTDSIAELHSRNIVVEEDDIPRHYVKIMGKCIIFNMMADKFYIKNDEEPMFVSPAFQCFRVDESRCIPEYLADCVVKEKSYRDEVLFGTALQKVDFGNLCLPFFESLESQQQIARRIYRQERNELQKKLERLQVLSGKSADLIHNLGVTFSKISADVGKLKKSGATDVAVSLYDNVQFALRQINSTGIDYAAVKPELEIVKVYEILDKYICAWRNFGNGTFSVELRRNSPDESVNPYMTEDTKIKVDPVLFYTMLDCIFINAHQHGFAKRKQSRRENDANRVVVEVKGVTYGDRRYVRIGISNNGAPIPDGYTVRDFVGRGVVGINSEQEGIGGDHVCKIAHHFGGLVSVESDNEWQTFSILLPVFHTSTMQFNEYECESV